MKIKVQSNQPTIIIGGDFVPRFRILEKFSQHSFDETISSLKEMADACDFSMLNLECPIIPDDIHAAPIVKTGPNLKVSPVAIDALKYIGINAVTLANNHFRDYGDEGVKSTIRLLDNSAIAHVGGGVNINEASKPLRVELGDKRISIINACEHEWSIADKDKAGSNPIDVIDLYNVLAEEKRWADFIIVVTHGGRELFRLPTPRMKKLYRHLIDCGADVVINHHQHCFSGYELYKDSPIFYGLGNLVFDKGQNAPKGWNEGYLVKLTIGSKISFELIPYVQCKLTPTFELVHDRTEFDAKISEINNIISDDDKLFHEYEKVTKNCIPIVKGVIEPYLGRLHKGLINKMNGPYLQTDKGYRTLLAHLQCETHYDIFMASLKSIVNGKQQSQ